MAPLVGGRIVEYKKAEPWSQLGAIGVSVLQGIITVLRQVDIVEVGCHHGVHAGLDTNREYALP